MADEARRDEAWRGRWCWVRKHSSRPWNSYAYFRRAVELSAEPRRAVARVSADVRYTLYVNARRVHQGPARSFPESQSFDTLDLTQYFEVGTNTICAVAHQVGVPTFSSQYRDASGFLFDCAIELEGETIVVHTPMDWVCRDAKGWRKDVARLSVQLGFQEHFDADVDPPDWMSPSFKAAPEDGWAAPWVAGPVGCHPWLHMEPRGVPLLAQRVEKFVTVTAQFKGDHARGYKITPDACNFIREEKRTKDRALLDKPLAMLADDAEVTTVARPVDGEFVMAVLDLGKYRTGHINLDLADAAGDEIIDVIFSEDVDKSGAPLLKGTAKDLGVCEEAPAFRYRCRAGPQCWESFQYLGLRYATLVVRNARADKPLKIRYVAIRQVHAAFEEAGTFECGDERLTKIWDVAKTTQLNCSFDALVDCPGREQAQWWGDARVQSLVTAYGFGDFTLLERGIRQVARSQASDGSLHAHPPADIPGHRLPDFMMAWVGSVREHAFHTGRADLAMECAPALHKLFDFFRRHESPNGLIGGFEGFWVFLDWATVRKVDFSATLNLAYLQATRDAADLCVLTGDKAAADRYRADAEALAASIDTHFWDPAAKVWRDGFDPVKNLPVDEVSQHANALAILLDLHPEAHAKIARDVLLKSARSGRTKVATASLFFYAYVLEAMIHAGLRKEAIALVREKWGAQVERGATTFWEHWEPTGSSCHAWSASPLYILSGQILGVTPTAPGWKRVRIAPLTSACEFAKGIVPTPLGALRVEWEQSGKDQWAVRIDVPDGMEAQFVSPLGDARVLGVGAHEFQT